MVFSVRSLFVSMILQLLHCIFFSPLSANHSVAWHIKLFGKQLPFKKLLFFAPKVQAVLICAGVSLGIIFSLFVSCSR